MSKQRGNILFLILLAVVLFAALSYAVTSSMRGGGRDASTEGAEAKASELLNYLTQVSGAVQRMMLVNNVRDYELNFYYQTASNFIYGTNDNTNCTESRCRVFDPNGGGVAGRTLERFQHAGAAADAKYTRLLYINVPGVGTDAPDIVLSMQGIDPAICFSINKKIGIEGYLLNVNPSPTTPSSAMYQNAIPVGPIVNNGINFTNIPANAALAGTFCGCNQPTADGCASTYRPIVYHVLVAR